MALVIVWAALRARPRPELISASPTHASGASINETMQSMVCDSDSTGGLAVTLTPLRRGRDMRAYYEDEAKHFDGQASQYEDTSSAGLLQEDKG
jgi:hypothetical protein